jgi:hypothetical protein
LVRADARVLQSKIENKDGESPEMQGLKVFAIVKETGIDDEGLLEFYHEYLPHPTYKDQERVFYTALGSGQISMGFNPIRIFKNIQDSLKRINDLGVKSYNIKGGKILRHIISCVMFFNSCLQHEHDIIGEGLLQGGWIIFDTNGMPCAAFQENAKERIPIESILAEAKKLSCAAK